MKRLWTSVVVLACVLWICGGLAMLPGYTQPEVAPESQLPHPSELWPMPEDNGYDDFLAAIELLPDESDWLGPRAGEILKEGLDNLTEAQLQGFFLAHQPALDKLRQALDKPFVVYYQWLFEPYPWAALFPELAKAREFARILSVQAAYHQRWGEHQQALDSLQQILMLGDNLSHGGVLIHRLVSIAIESIGLKGWKEWIVRMPPAEVLHQASQFLQEFERQQVPLWQTFVMEAWCGRQMLKDQYQQVLSPEKLKELKRKSPDLAAGLPNWDELLEGYERWCLKFFDIVRLPPSEAVEQQPPQVATPILKELLPILIPVWLDQTLPKSGYATARLRATQIMVSLERYRQAHGGVYPAVLQDSVPEYLAELPKDPFTDQDFIFYHKLDFTYKLYSVGPNKLDDGGAQAEDYWTPDDPDIVIAN